LNPIELAFSKLKALLRAKTNRTAEALWMALGDLCDSFSPGECADTATMAISSQRENALAWVGLSCYARHRLGTRRHKICSDTP
jgi:hypothetical protein